MLIKINTTRLRSLKYPYSAISHFGIDSTLYSLSAFHVYLVSPSPADL